MPAGSLHTDRSRKSQRSGPTATKAIELVWAFTQPADGQLRHDTARGTDGVLSLAVHVGHRHGQRPDSTTAVDLHGPIEAHVTAALWRGANPKPNPQLNQTPNQAPNQTPILSTVATLAVQRRGRWTHLKLTISDVAPGSVAASCPVDADAAEPTLLVAAFRDGVAIHLRSSLPSMAGLPGGTYERPTLTLGEPLARLDLATGLEKALGTAV